MRAVFTWTAVLLASLSTSERIGAAEPELVATVPFKGEIRSSNDLSAVAAIGDLLVIGGDEGSHVQVLRRVREKDGGYELVQNVELGKPDQEIDIEGIATASEGTAEGSPGTTVYVVGSHSATRKSVSPKRPHAENLKRLEDVRPQPARDRLLRFRLSDDGVAGPPEEAALRGVLNAHPVLGLFGTLPGKENGIDIEGIAVHAGRVYLGFRGPVLRGNYVPVLRCDFSNPAETSELLYVNLGGLGIRDMTRVDAGFLLLAGPTGDASGPYRLFMWDGHDALPGTRNGSESGRVELLADIPVTGDAKPEGITVMKHDNESDQSEYRFMVIYDGAENGGAKLFRLRKL